MGTIKFSDYIVETLITKGITDVFGYPGGMVTHLMDSFDKYSGKIKAHINYNEQGSAFCACAYASVSGLPGFAYSTSGPGVTNLLTGIANAYFDSVPAVFVSGQVNTFEQKGALRVRQRGFQEMNAAAIAQSVTKYSAAVNSPGEAAAELHKAFDIAVSGRPGPVLLDIAMDVSRAQIENTAPPAAAAPRYDNQKAADAVISALSQAKRPLVIAGAGVRTAGAAAAFWEFVEKNSLPVVTSMISVDLLPSDSPLNFGFIGAYGHRSANILTEKADVVLALGTRLDLRQTGANRGAFAPKSRLVRVDIDEGELAFQVKPDEEGFAADLKELLPLLNAVKPAEARYEWLEAACAIRSKLRNADNQPANDIMRALSARIPDGRVITTDVGQNQVWAAQSFQVKPSQRVLFTGGHGAMGYSLPAAIGSYYASRKPVYCVSGDGGLMMNIQELQFIKREKLPVKILLFNNRSLGMIRHFQEMYFHSNYAQTLEEKGYSAPDFERLAGAFGLRYYKTNAAGETAGLEEALGDDDAAFIEIALSDKTYVSPKLAFNKPLYDQEPPLDPETLDEIMRL